MPTREELHKLTDSLPEGAMEAAFRSLSHLQVWPPPPPPTLEEMGTFVAETAGPGVQLVQTRRYKGHELRVIERIRVDGQHLIYNHAVVGPGNKRDEREIVFDLS